MFFKFDSAAIIIDEMEVYRGWLDKREEHVNYALLFTEYSRYNFFKNNYEEVGNLRVINFPPYSIKHI